MDLLYQRYANPFPFMDGMIQTGRFCEFVDELVAISNKEKEDRANWEFFLHKVWEGSFGEFLESMKTDKQNQTMSNQTMEATVKMSIDMLKNFNPEKKGGET